MMKIFALLGAVVVATSVFMLGLTVAGSFLVEVEPRLDRLTLGYHIIYYFGSLWFGLWVASKLEKEMR